MHPYVHSSTIYSSQDTEATSMSIHRWMDEEDMVYVCIYVYTHTHTHTPTQIEYYSAIKKNKVIPFAATWMDLEIIILVK